MIEHLKDLSPWGYDGYWISDLGYVLNVNTRHVLWARRQSGQVGLYNAVTGKTDAASLKALVAQHFLEPEEGYQYVYFLDGNEHNTAASNLGWCTRSVHLKRKQLESWRLVQRGETLDVIKSRTPFSYGYINGLLNLYLSGKVMNEFIADNPGRDWVDERIDWVNALCPAVEITLELPEDAISLVNQKQYVPVFTGVGKTLDGGIVQVFEEEEEE